MTRIEKQLRPTALELLKEPLFTQNNDVVYFNLFSYALDDFFFIRILFKFRLI